MKLSIKISIICVLMSFQLLAQEAKVSVKTDTNAILIGEQVRLDLRYELPSNKKPLFPAFTDTINSQLEIVGRTKIDTLVDKNTGTQVLSQQLMVTSFDTGYLIIPPIPFGMMENGDTTYQVFQSEPLLLNVFTVEVDTTKEIKPIVRPIAEPYTLSEFLPWIMLSFALAVLIFAVFYFIKRRKKNKPLFAKKEKPQLPAHEQALLDLENLRLKKLWQNDRLKEYHSELTDIIRVYLERRFGIAAMEMVSFEILEELKKTTANDQIIAKLKATFELADMIKFAKSGATPIENDTSLNNCIDFVNETKQLEEKLENGKEPTHVS